jgi:hypothetical protein
MKPHQRRTEKDWVNTNQGNQQTQPEVYIAQVSSSLSRCLISSVQSFITLTIVFSKLSGRTTNAFKSGIVTLLSLIPFRISYLK